MAYYRLGQVIKMRRIALKYGREDFDAEGPSGMTVYRVEEGKTNATEQTYRSLTKSMGMEESTRQGVLKTDSMTDLYLVNEISQIFQGQDEEKVGKLLNQLEESIDFDVPRNRQYIEWIRAKLCYRKKQITAAEYETVIRKALSYTIPHFENISLREWPFREEELRLMIALNNALKAQKKYAEQKQLLEDIIEVLNTGYMNQEYKEKYFIAILMCFADALGNMGRHEDAIQRNREVVRLCVQYKEFKYMVKVYYDIHWSYWELKKQKTLSVQEETECRQCLVRAYYVSKVQGIRTDFYEKRLKERYPEEMC